jgi:hypothetical protein
MLHALDQAGFTIVDNPYEAAVVIAHSGGCLLVAEDMPAQKVILIGPCYWPGRSIPNSLIRKNINDFRIYRHEHTVRQWANKFSWNCFYFWNMPRNFAMLRALRDSPSWRARNVTVVRNHDDSFCTPDLKSLPFTHKARFVELPGQHDDLWVHPTPYINLLQSLHE